jgi:hypothetical protein
MANRIDLALADRLRAIAGSPEPLAQLADTEYDVAWFYTASDAQSPRDAAWEAWQVMRAPSSIANVFCVTARDGTQHEIDLSESDTPERP